MSTLNTYRGESSVDLSIRGFNHLEGIVKFCIDNGLAIDYEESTGINRLVDDVKKNELKNNRPMFPPKPAPKKERVTVNSGQNIVDLVLQETGSIEGYVGFLRGNGFSPISVPAVGQELKALAEDIKNTEVQEYYRSIGYKVNTSGASAEADHSGIFDFTFDFTFE